MAVLKYRNTETGEWETIPHVIHGSSGDGYELTDEDKNEIAGLVESVSYSQTQNLTDEQKEIARNNIGAVDANLVVSEIHTLDAIPNGEALVNFAANNCVMVEWQNLSDVNKRTARKNIGAISQAELDEAVANISGGGSGDGYELTDEDKNEIAGLVEAVSYSQTQNLTDEQKETARNNINAVQGSLVTDKITDGKQIVTGNSLIDFVDNTLYQFGIVSFQHDQSWRSPEEQAQARENIGAVSKAELDSAVIDGIVVKDTTNSVDYIAKLRLVDGKPVIEYVEI